MKRRRIMGDYTLVDAVAAAAYMEPISTGDLDIIVLADTDEEYLRVFRQMAEAAEGREGMHYVLGGVPVQMFPTAVKPLYKDTLQWARRARVGGLRVKVASPEHLVLLALESFRAKDKLRILHLLGHVDSAKLQSLLERFDGTGSLTKKLQSLL